MLAIRCCVRFSRISLIDVLEFSTTGEDDDADADADADAGADGISGPVAGTPGGDGADEEPSDRARPLSRMDYQAFHVLVEFVSEVLPKAHPEFFDRWHDTLLHMTVRLARKPGNRRVPGLYKLLQLYLNVASTGGIVVTEGGGHLALFLKRFALETQDWSQHYKDELLVF